MHVHLQGWGKGLFTLSRDLNCFASAKCAAPLVARLRRTRKAGGASLFLQISCRFLVDFLQISCRCRADFVNILARTGWAGTKIMMSKIRSLRQRFCSRLRGSAGLGRVGHRLYAMSTIVNPFLQLQLYPSFCRSFVLFDSFQFVVIRLNSSGGVGVSCPCNSSG